MMFNMKRTKAAMPPNFKPSKYPFLEAFFPNDKPKMNIKTAIKTKFSLTAKDRLNAPK